MTAVQLRERMTDRRLTPAQRQQATREYGQMVAAEFGIDAYGTRTLPVRGAVR